MTYPAYPCLCGHPAHNGPCPLCDSGCTEYEPWDGTDGPRELYDHPLTRAATD
jgi:hypothetical protein